MIYKLCQQYDLPDPEWTSDKFGVTLTFHTQQDTQQVKTLISYLSGEMSQYELMGVIG